MHNQPFMSKTMIFATMKVILSFFFSNFHGAYVFRKLCSPLQIRTRSCPFICTTCLVLTFERWHFHVANFDRPETMIYALAFYEFVFLKRFIYLLLKLTAINQICVALFLQIYFHHIPDDFIENVVIFCTLKKIRRWPLLFSAYKVVRCF